MRERFALSYAKLRMKITFLQVDEAFRRNVWGESVRAIARDFGVTEGALRFHFRKGTSPKQVRRLAYDLFHVEQMRAQLLPADQKEVARQVAKARALVA